MIRPLIVALSVAFFGLVALSAAGAGDPAPVPVLPSLPEPMKADIDRGRLRLIRFEDLAVSYSTELQELLSDGPDRFVELRMVRSADGVEGLDVSFLTLVASSRLDAATRRRIEQKAADRRLAGSLGFRLQPRGVFTGPAYMGPTERREVGWGEFIVMGHGDTAKFDVGFPAAKIPYSGDFVDQYGLTWRVRIQRAAHDAKGNLRAADAAMAAKAGVAKGFIYSAAPLAETLVVDVAGARPRLVAAVEGRARTPAEERAAAAELRAMERRKRALELLPRRQ